MTLSLNAHLLFIGVAPSFLAINSPELTIIYAIYKHSTFGVIVKLLDREIISNSKEPSKKSLAWILHEGGIYKNKMAISLISGHGYVNFHLNYV